MVQDTVLAYIKKTLPQVNDSSEFVLDDDAMDHLLELVQNFEPQQETYLLSNAPRYTEG